MSTPPPPHPAYQHNPGAYQQAPGAYPQSPGPYQQAPAAYGQAPGAYQQAPVGHPQPSGPYGQAPGGYPQAPDGHGQAPYPQAPGGYGQAGYQQAPGAYPSAAGAGCEVCGAAPATEVTVRGHQGMLIIMRQLRRRGTFCRSCGLAVFRKMQSDTMAQGWWGPASMMITPITLLINLFALAKIRKLPAPVAAQGPGLDPGRSVFARPMGIVGLVPLLGFTSFLLLVFIGMAAG
ncbi:hypothetical protein GCM10010260_22890 [Streptomyces filipinensis]|uniref:Uncharacterized protein n=1 Tax=Streptomyces filipinensis TaxID=66887 RepID=A0A918MAX5_9ACTN|nr:hypothetical protein [Streptomyces filipinensis]GGU88604.1 hypothetical protein GCM10010260_22890 [Streptomyces filipinensis]